MIHYQLCCSADHGFDGWFNDSAGFDKQVRMGLVECPTCGVSDVRRALMAPAVGRRSKPAQAVAKRSDRTVAVAKDHLPDQVRAMLQKLRAEVEKNSDYVGGGFADEARRIHNGESDRRSIYGEASPEQAEALAEDGIEVSRIPWVPRADG
jgi:hypothetical protein